MKKCALFAVAASVLLMSAPSAMAAEGGNTQLQTLACGTHAPLTGFYDFGEGVATLDANKTAEGFAETIFGSIFLAPINVVTLGYVDAYSLVGTHQSCHVTGAADVAIDAGAPDTLTTKIAGAAFDGGLTFGVAYATNAASMMAMLIPTGIVAGTEVSEDSK